MENIITHFNFQSTHQVRIAIDDQGEPLFCLKDVAHILDVQNAKCSRFNLDDKGVHKMYLPTQSGHQHITFINEPNLYRVIFRSNKKEARAFQDWVFNDVLPSIRKTGTYTVPTVQDDALSGKDWNNLKRLIFLCESSFFMKNSVRLAIWQRLRRVTGVQSPDKFGARHLPALAVEFEKIFKASEQYFMARKDSEKKFIRQVLRLGDDEAAAIIADEIRKFEVDFHSLKHQYTSLIFGEAYQNLIDRT